MIKSKLLNWVQKALYDLATVYLCSPISYYYPFAPGPLAILNYFWIMKYAILSLDPFITLAFPFLLGPHFLQAKGGVGDPPMSPLAACPPPLVPYHIKCSGQFTCLSNVGLVYSYILAPDS